MINTGRFDDPASHHRGWFRVFRFEGGTIELWFGHRWVMISR